MVRERDQPRGCAKSSHGWAAYDTDLDLPPNVDADTLVDAMDGHVLVVAELTGTFALYEPRRSTVSLARARLCVWGRVH